NQTPQKWRTRSTPNPRARRLVASKPNSMPNHTNHTTPTHHFPTPKKPKPLKCVLTDAQTPCSHSQYPAHTRTTHTGVTPACTLSSTEFIDIPPMSNPPAPHSG